ncbi:UNVERIFIED_CONTAM: hypothetical protein H355_007036 [Colinus virginianus]|nr:hypothetical protein H355_007036 [Colinus virginianus]
MAACRGRRLLWHGRCWFSQDPAAPPPAPAPLYPPIVASHTAKSKAAKRRRLELFYQQVHEAATIEEKLRLYGKLQRPKYMVYPQTFALNADRWYRSFTKTVFVPGLPPTTPPAAATAPEPGAAEALEQGAAAAGATEASEPGAATATEAAAEAEPELDLGALRDLACDALLQESFYQNKKRPFLYRDQDHTPAPFLTQLVSSLAAFLCKRNPLLAASSLDLNPEVNYYWHHGEEVVVHGHRKGRVDPVRFQIDDKPHLQIRVPKQLPEFVPLDSDLGDVPVVDHKPSKLPLFKKQYENKVFIGFWSEADVTRPFVSQAVVTDGKYFAFFGYQLNTLALTVETIQKNSRKNICWGTDSAYPHFEEAQQDFIEVNIY